MPRDDQHIPAARYEQKIILSRCIEPLLSARRWGIAATIAGLGHVSVFEFSEGDDVAIHPN
jgi:hypothetical protein